jgi:cytochrome c oxidase subunit 2
MLAICAVIFVAVFGVMFYSVYAHRKSKGHKPATFHESTTVEIAWTVVPMIIVIVMAALATKTVLAMKDTSNADLTIKATGYQWKWGYDYVKGEGEGISFYSSLSTPVDQIEGKAEKGINYMLEVDNEVVVPVGKKVRILTTAQDVIHAWMIPAFGVKQDAIPGFIRDTWFKADKVGVYRGQCAELCGKEHGFMPIVVNVKTDADYSKWVEEQKKLMAAKMDDPNKQWTKAELVARGEKVYAAACVACHQATGKGTPPAFPPLDGAKVVQGPKDNQVAVLINGRQGTAMASFKSLSDVELAAVIAYTRNSWGNKSDDVPMPADIKAAKAWDAAKLTQLAAKPQ